MYFSIRAVKNPQQVSTRYLRYPPRIRQLQGSSETWEDTFSSDKLTVSKVRELFCRSIFVSPEACELYRDGVVLPTDRTIRQVQVHFVNIAPRTED